MKQKTIPIVLVSLLLGLVFDWFFYGKVPGVSVALYACLILGFTFCFARQFRHPLNRSIYWLTPVVLFFALMVFVRASSFLAFMNIALVMYLLLVVARLAHQPTVRLSQFEILQYLSLMGRVPLRIVHEFFQVAQKVVNHRNPAVRKSSYVPILRGLILSLPVLFVFLLLLSSADVVFKEYITSLLDLNISSETIFRYGLAGFVASLFAGAYALIIMPTSTLEPSPTLDRKQFDLGTTESSIILGSVSVLFFVFVLIQFRYLFEGSSHVASTGHTYAEYARKGFFELIAVAAISLVLILAIKKATMFRTVSQTLVFKALSGVLMVEVMVIMLSAHLRLNLYEDAYGFTILRLLSHLFILWLAAAFILLIIHIVREKSEKNLALQLFISALCFFALINLINPDAFIARQNINRFNDTGKLDLDYLRNLSEDATPEIAGLLDHPDKNVQMDAATVLYQQKQLTAGYLTHWQSSNVARSKADQIFRDHAGQIKTARRGN